MGSGSDARYRVKMDGSDTTSWTTKVRGILEDSAASAVNNSPAVGMVSPAFAAMAGLPPPTSAPSKGAGKGAPRSAPPPRQTKPEEPEEFPPQTIVEIVSAGQHKGKCGTVLKIN